MARFNRRSGVSLLLVGLLGTLFFWMTDPRYGMGLRWDRTGNPIDLANEHFPGTVIGIAGSLVIFGIGTYLVSRRSL